VLKRRNLENGHVHVQVLLANRQITQQQLRSHNSAEVVSTDQVVCCVRQVWNTHKVGETQQEAPNHLESYR